MIVVTDPKYYRVGSRAGVTHCLHISTIVFTLQGFWRAHKADMHIVEAVHFAKRKDENVAVPTYSAKAKVPRKTRQNHQPHAPLDPLPLADASPSRSSFIFSITTIYNILKTPLRNL